MGEAGGRFPRCIERPEHQIGRPSILIASLPAPAAHSGQTTSIQGTEATYYQEGLTSDRDERSERPPTVEDCSLGRKGGGEEQGDQPDHQAAICQDKARLLDTPHGGAN